MAHKCIKCIYLLFAAHKNQKPINSHPPTFMQTRPWCFIDLTVYCLCVSQKPVCVTVSVMADNLIVFTLWFAKASHFSSLPISALKPTEVYKYWALILGPQTAGPAVWCSTNDWVFMSKISSGRPLFPLYIDIGANKKLRKRGAPICEYLSELK